MKRVRQTEGKPRRWKCALCTASGYDPDPAWQLEEHYYDRHHTPAPF